MRQAHFLGKRRLGIGEVSKATCLQLSTEQTSVFPTWSCGVDVVDLFIEFLDPLE